VASYFNPFPAVPHLFESGQVFGKLWVHGYKHGYHFGEGGTEKVEAAQFILEVFRRLEVPWDREIKPLRGWERKEDFS